MNDRHRPSFLDWLRNAFVSGVALVLPFVVTVWVVWVVVTFVDGNVIPLLPHEVQPMARSVPGVGLAITLVALTLVGALAHNFVSRFVLSLGERFIANLPVVRSIYGGSKQIVAQIAAPEGASFKHGVLIEFPSPGLWSVGFVTNENVTNEAGEGLVAVFVPLAPLPTTGFLLYARRDALRRIASADEALKQVLSLGIVKHDDENGRSA